MKFLLVRFSAIGDCVMAVPVAEALRRLSPEAHLVWAVEERCAPVVSRELVSTRAEIPGVRWKKGRWSPAIWREQLGFYAGLRREGFDFGLDLQGHAKTALCLRLAAPKRRLAAQARDGLARSLHPTLEERQGERHVVEWNLFALERLLARPVGEPVWRMPQEDGEEFAGGGRLATISVGAGRPHKEVSAEHWAAVAEALLKDGWRVAFLGGPTDRAPQVQGALDWVGRLSLARSMAAVAASGLHLAADTGSGHLAAAYGVPVVSVFGPTDPAHYRPYTKRGVVLREGTDPNAVEPAAILEAARRLLAEARV